MPKLKYKLPSYRHHRASGQATVSLNGRDLYLGAYGSPESKASYERLLAEWLASHKQLTGPQSRQTEDTDSQGLTINELFLAYWDFAKRYYRKNGKERAKSHRSSAP